MIPSTASSPRTRGPMTTGLAGLIVSWPWVPARGRCAALAGTTSKQENGSGFEHDRPVGLVIWQHPGLLHGGGLPFPPRVERHDGVHIGARDRPHVDRVSRKARDDRRVHGVRCPEAAEQELPAAPETRTA